MQENHLDWLYSQFHSELEHYATAKDRVTKLSAAIIAYGGSVPDISAITNENIQSILSGLSDTMYPKKGTWKEKILFILKRYGRPITASEVSEYILDNERQFNGPVSPQNNTASVIPVILSKMGIDGEIGVDNSQFKNKYFLKNS